MSVTKIAYRYARAFYEEGREKGIADKMLADMELLGDTLMSNHTLAKFLHDPSSASDQKFEVIRELFSRYLDKSTIPYIGFLAHKRRLNLIKEISEQMKLIHRRQIGVLPIKVTLSPGLGEDFGKKVVDKVAELTGNRFEAEFKEDDSLQGGFTYSYEGEVFDYSVRGGMKALEKKLHSASID